MFWRVGKKEPPNLRMALSIIHAFHMAGWVHGDARVPNVVQDDRGAFLIDMATVRQVDPSGRCEDIAQYVRSYLGLPKWNFETGWQTSFAKHPTVIRAIQSMGTGSELEENLSELVRLVQQLKV